jgi:hypothetical protein
MFGAPNGRSDGRDSGVAARDRGDVVGGGGERNDASGVEGVRAGYGADFFYGVVAGGDLEEFVAHFEGS